MFFIPKKSKNLINQILLSDFAQRYLNFGNGNRAKHPPACAVVNPDPIFVHAKKHFRFSIQPE
jgi:hypothetical protein